MIFPIPEVHLRFKDRISAAKMLASAVKDVLINSKSEIDDNNILVLGIPRGGVLVADIVASKLKQVCDFDIIIPRKLRAPYNHEVSIGAIMEDGFTYLNDLLLEKLGISKEYLDKEQLEQIKEIKRRRLAYFGNNNSSETGNSILELESKILNKVVILVDDGAATGATLIAAVRWIKVHKPSCLIVAVPIAPKETVLLLQNDVEKVETITSPRSLKFKSVDQYYHNFNPVSDTEVMGVIQRRIKT